MPVAAPAAPPRPARAVPKRGGYPGEAVVRFQRDPLAFLRWLDAAGAAAGADVVRVRLGGAAVLLRHPDLAAEVLLAPPGTWDKGPQIAFSARLFGRGLLTSEPPHHTRVRKLVLPAFAHGRLGDYAETVVRLTDAHVGRWVEAGTVDLTAAAAALTYEIAEATLFGAGGLEGGAAVRAGVAEALVAFQRVARNPVLVGLSRWLPVPAARRLSEVRARIVPLLAAAVRRRRAAGDPGDDLLGMLLVAQDEATGDGLTDGEVVDEALTVLLAGHETTASALAWAWLLLDRHPAQAERLAAEADGAGRLGMDALGALPVARGVLAETMRLYPPAYLLDRTAPGPRRVGGVEVPGGATVLLSPALLHRDPRWWDRPDAFDPDRPALTPRGGAHRFAYLPFSVGTRGCVGERFAWMEGTLVLAAVARRARLVALGPWPDPLCSLTLRPDGAVPVRVEPR